MPLQVISGPVAVETAKLNPFSNWPERGSANNRLEPFAKPAFTPSFRLEPGESILTIGSCFARNIEIELEERGFDIPTRRMIQADLDFARIGYNVLNNYGAPSIWNEISWALDPDRPFNEHDAFFEIFPGKFIDAHLNPGIKPASIETLRSRRRAITAAYRTIQDCRVSIITLGLAECWFDRRTGVYINTAPRRSMIRLDPERFEVHVLSYEEVMGFLTRTIDLIVRHCRPDFRIVLTVSPVPLTATYRDQDVMVANAYSKAVLRAASEALVTAHDFIDYFPSYESVVLSERGLALLSDQVHPTPEVVAVNVRRMLGAYVDDTKMSVHDVRDKIANAGRQSAIFRLLESRPDLVQAHSDLALAYANAALQLHKPDIAKATLAYVDNEVSSAARAIVEARAELALNNPNAAIKLLVVEPEERRHKIKFWTTLLEANMAIGDLDRAKICAAKYSTLKVRAPQPLSMLGKAFSMAGRDAEADTFFRQALELSDDNPAVTLDFVEHLGRTGRRADGEPFLAHIVPANPAHQARLDRLKSGLD